MHQKPTTTFSPLLGFLLFPSPFPHLMRLSFSLLGVLPPHVLLNIPASLFAPSKQNILPPFLDLSNSKTEHLQRTALSLQSSISTQTFHWPFTLCNVGLLPRQMPQSAFSSWTERINVPPATWPHNNWMHCWYSSYPQFFMLPALNNLFHTHSLPAALWFLTFIKYLCPVILLERNWYAFLSTSWSCCC